MIQIRRVLLCDGCGAASLDVLFTVDSDNPDWQGWEPIRDDSDPLQPEAIKHRCPECVAGGKIVVASSEWTA